MTAEMIGIGLGTGVSVLLIMTANWLIFTKAGRPGWQSLIPVYNVYAQYKICWNGWIGIFSLILATTIGTLALAGEDPMNLAALVIILFMIQMVFCYKFAKAFGKGFLMGLVLMFTAGLGRMVLGFGKSVYVRKA